MATKRYRGVKPLGAGRYELRLWWEDPKTGRKRETVLRRTAKSAAEASRIRLVELDERKRGGVAQARVRLSDYGESWLRSRAPAWKASTQKTNTQRLGRALDDIGDNFLDALTRDDIAAWRDSIDQKPDTVNGYLRVLKQVTAEAARDLDIKDPAAGVAYVRRVQADNAPPKALSVEDMKRTLAHIRVHEAEAWPLVATLAYTGFRFGEVTALKWADVDLEGATLTIRRAQWCGIVDSPKEVAHRRTVPIPEEAVGALRRHRIASKRIQGWVFETRKRRKYAGRERLPYSSYLSGPVHRAFDALEIARRPAAHCWRHTWNNLLRQVTSELVRQELIGHSGEEIGQRYSHVTLDEKRQAQERALKLVKG